MTKQEFIEWVHYEGSATHPQSIEEDLDAVIKSEIEARTTALQSLIDTLEIKKYSFPQSKEEIYWNKALQVAIDILKSTPCIKATGYFQYETYTDIRVDNKDLPNKFRLKDIEILLP